MDTSRNFDLRLSGTLSAVRVEVIDSPAGQHSAPDALPCGVSANALKDLYDLAPGVDVEAIGRALWRCAFGDRVVERLWAESKPEPGSEGILRLRLTVDAAELAALPWELLYDEALGRFLALDGQTPVTRFTRLPIPSIPWPQDRPLRMLFTAASPDARYTKVHIAAEVVAGEWERIEQVLAPLIKARRLETEEVLAGPTMDALLAALPRGLDIWHYFGHGEEASLLFVDAQGRVERVDAGILGQTLAGAGVRLAMLSSCLAGAGGGQATSVAGALVRVGIPVVVAMQTLLSYNAAQVFAGHFYDAVAAGQGVDQALTAARRAIFAGGASEWWAPALFMRTPEGRIWRGPVKGAAADVRAVELAYLDGVIEKYQYWAEKYTPLAGIAEVRTAAAQGPRLDLPMLFMPTGFEKLEEHGFGEQRRTERVPVDDLRAAVAKYKRMVLLGEPGSGKTTTLWRLAYDLAITAKDDPHAPLPLFVPLGGYSGPESALDYVQRHFEELADQLLVYLRGKRVVLLLDALNEMPQSDRDKRVERVQTLLDDHPDVSVVVTCRALDYVETLRLEKLEVKPLEPEQQRAYLRRYLDEAEGDKLFWQLCGEEIANLWQIWQQAGGTWQQFWTVTDKDAELWRALRQDGLPPLLALGRNPFMLVMTAQVYVAGGGVLPQNRGRLFAAFVDALLERERKRCDPTIWPGTGALRDGMAVLAYAMQEAGERGTAVAATWATQRIAPSGVNGERILYLCASATLLDIANSQVGFVHQLVQEYFAALALRNRLDEGTTDLRQYWPNGWADLTGWEETVVLLAGILPDMTPLVKHLLVANPPLAARCIAESGGGRPTEGVVQAVQQRLAELMTDPRVVILERNAAGVAVNFLGDPRRGVGLRADGLPDIEWVFVSERDPKSGRKEFIYGEPGEQRSEADFWIARYPITYRQFQAFLDAADGFHNLRWWEGLAVSKEHRLAPGEQRFKHWNHPRENTSWYDAIAFCRWLTEKAKEHPDLLPKDLECSRAWKIILPTEQQWEKAARGHDARQYPWGGDKYKPGYANINETWTDVSSHNLQKTSAVGMYPQGNSPDGVTDLCGNVWEWCLNEYFSPERVQLEGNPIRVLRGGSWYLNQNHAAAPFRHRSGPHGRLQHYGFRVCTVIRQE